MSEPWERITEGEAQESKEAYAAALAYFELGPGRSLKKLAEKLAKGHRAGSKQDRSRIKVSGHVRTWCARYNWVERAKAYDARESRIRHEATAVVIAEAAKSDAQVAIERQRAFRESLWSRFEFADKRMGETERQAEPNLKELIDLQRFFANALPMAREAIGMGLPTPDAAQCVAEASTVQDEDSDLSIEDIKSLLAFETESERSEKPKGDIKGC